jgi:hypothetical protein
MYFDAKSSLTEISFPNTYDLIENTGNDDTFQFNKFHTTSNDSISPDYPSAIAFILKFLGMKHLEGASISNSQYEIIAKNFESLYQICPFTGESKLTNNPKGPKIIYTWSKFENELQKYTKDSMKLYNSDKRKDAFASRINGVKVYLMTVPQMFPPKYFESNDFDILVRLSRLLNAPIAQRKY